MSFFEKLEDIRQKPVGARRKILFFSMAISMSAIIILWVGLLKYKSAGEEDSLTKGPSPWQVIKNTFENVRRK